MEVPSLVLASLAAGHEVLLGADPGNGAVVVHELLVRDAAAMRELVRGWELRNSVPVTKLVRADAVLALIESSVLPALALNPARGVWLEELLRLSRKLESLGNRVGGTFRGRAAGLARRIGHFGVEVRRARRSDDARRHRAIRLREKVTALRDTVVSIDE